MYAVIRCEEDSVRTRIFKKDGSPEFNTKAIFYSRNPKSKISIEVRGYTTSYVDNVCISEAKGNYVCVQLCIAVEKRRIVGLIPGWSTTSDRRKWTRTKQSDWLAGWPITGLCFCRDLLQPVSDRPVTDRHAQGNDWWYIITGPNKTNYISQLNFSIEQHQERHTGTTPLEHLYYALLKVTTVMVVCAKVIKSAGQTRKNKKNVLKFCNSDNVLFQS